MKLSKSFFNEIRELIRAARTAVARGVDLVQVRTNFEIGRRIVNQEQHGEGRAAYGKEVIKALAARLTREFGEGFSKRNLELMRRFYLTYTDRRSEIAQTASAQLASKKKTQTLSAQLASHKKAQTLSAQFAPGGKSQTPSGQSQIFEMLSGVSRPASKRQGVSYPSSILQTASAKSPPADKIPPRPFTVSWSHYVFLLGIKNADERSFYEIESTNQNWTIRELKRQFDASLYERLALSRDKKGIRKLAQEGHIIARPEDLLKEPLVLEFLGLDERHQYSESDLESAVISQIERFLLEMGKGFLFEARQRRFTFDEEHYHVDLVFYNRLLRCYVLIDLKIGKLTHQDLGQMQMYVNYYDRKVKLDEENSTVGIVLCKQKNKALVEITLPEDANIHAREYRLYLPSKAELQKKLVEWADEVGDK